MAFTSRAQRSSDHLTMGNTPTSVGPGSYGAYFNHEIEHAYAPFSSTSDRDMGGAIRPPSFVTPGPGSYNLAGKRYQGGPRFQTSPNDVGFLSRGKRLGGNSQEDLLKPGPGQYVIPSAFNGRRKSAPSQQRSSQSGAGGGRNVQWVRAPTAPSIPMQNQAFGYEEGPAGQLVKQKAPVETYTGTRGDIPGPGNYDPSISYTRPNVKGSDFGRSKAERSTIKVSQAPGPGDYQSSDDHGKGASRAKKMSANFASRVLRPHQVERNPDSKVPVPGPGAYSIPDSFGKARQSLPDSLQCFNSTSKRLDDYSKNSTPGPGAYDDPRMTAPSNRGGLVPNRSAPFLTTSTRSTAGGAADIPGPGAYDNENRNTFVAMLARKRFGRAGAFGSKSKRFTAAKEDEDAANKPPAVVVHKEPKTIAGQLKKGPMSVFASTSNRFEKGNAADSQPAPGQYYKPPEWGSGYKPPEHASRTAFITSSKRFEGPGGMISAKEMPGPGAYSQAANTLGANVSNVLKKKALFGDDFSGSAFGTEKRFHMPNNKKDAPGPGQYDALDPYSQLLKRSFNITVEGSI